MALESNALTTLATLKEELKITVADFDSYLERLINVYSTQIETLCNRKFQQQAVSEEEVIGHGTRYLSVERYPIDSIDEILYRDTEVDSSSYQIDGDGGAGLIINLDGTWHWDVMPAANTARDPIPGSERPYYKVSYTGGYVLPNDDGTRDLPYDLEDLCVMMCVEHYRRQGEDRKIKSEKVLTGSVTYFGADEVPALWTSIINSYRRVI